MTAPSALVNLILQKHHAVEMIKTPSSWCGRGSQGTKGWRGVTDQGRAVTASGRKAGGLGSRSGFRGGRGCAEEPGGAGAAPVQLGTSAWQEGV